VLSLGVTIIYKNLYWSSLTISSSKYEINARRFNRSNHYEIAVYELPSYKLMTDYVPTYSNSAEVKKDLKMWLKILKEN
jgi:hypothetical protein